MSAFGREDDDAGGDDHTLLVEEHVDESQLKLPTHKFDVAKAAPVKSLEEEEDVIFQERCNLLVRSGTEWKERGKGDIKLLQHRETKLVRCIMRQEKTLKLRANHKIEPGAIMTAHHGSEKAYIWKAHDFADGTVVETPFCAMFKNKEKADAFKKAYLDGAANNKDVLSHGGHGKSPAKPTPSPAPAGGAGTVAAPVFSSPLKPKAAAPVEDTTGPVPQTDSLGKIYGSAAESDAIIRYGDLALAFKNKFGTDPTFFVRAPGRVNLIGEHIDYHGYSVLPMALHQDVVIAVAPAAGASSVSVANTQATFAPAQIPLNPAAPIDTSAGVQWHQYVHCGFKGAVELKKHEPTGLSLLVDGTVPTGAGVSSSSALTVASFLAVAHAYGTDASATRAQIAEAARHCETYIGMMSGGMDQAISCLAEAGSAARIDFEPIRATSVALPAGATFVVSNTLEESAKAVDAEKRYNKRVTEGKIAAKLLAKAHGLASWSKVQTLRQLQEEAHLAGPGALLPLIEAHLHEAAYSLAELAGVFGAEVSTLFEGDAKKDGALKVLSSVGRDDKAFELRKRARHVASEAERVLAFEAAARGKVRHADGSTVALEGGAEAQLKAMGELMDQSQASGRDDYECSSDGLNEITALAKSLGAYGSRLTGAGWGGCAVSLVPTSKVNEFIEGLKTGYYAKRGKDASKAVFASAPGSGAAIYNPPTSFEI